MAQKIAHILGGLDELVFPDNPIKEILIVKGGPKGKLKAWIGYVPPENTEDGFDRYQIYGYRVDKYIARQMKTLKVMQFHGKERKTNWNKLPKISERELLIGFAAHEVRHRIQARLGIELISPDVKDIKNNYVREVIKFIKILFEESPPKGDYKLEFDATVIEYIVREIWHHKKGSPFQVVEIVKSGARNLKPRF